MLSASDIRLADDTITLMATEAQSILTRNCHHQYCASHPFGHVKIEAGGNRCGRLSRRATVPALEVARDGGSGGDDARPRDLGPAVTEVDGVDRGREVVLEPSAITTPRRVRPGGLHLHLER